MKEIPVILISHGHYAKYALESAEMIIGKQENCEVISVTEDKDLDSVTKELEEVYKKLKNEKGVIILTDIRGGTPSNAAANLLVRESDILALSGYNMPLLLELFTNRDLEMEDLKEGLYEAFRESLVDLRAETAGLCEEEIEL